MKIDLPEQVKYIIDTLTTAGHEAFAVGGCVRDSILGKKPEDWDITTSALPEQIKVLFKRTIDTGIKHGTVTVMIKKVGYEITTYRIDGEYEDSRHPKEVNFTKDLIEDLKRRDFTINAMAYNEDVGLVDEFNGVLDLKGGIIRCVGNPEKRFEEDALRMMRAIRFSAQLGYTIDEDTKKAIHKLRFNLKNISAERVQVELTKLITSNNPEFLEKAYDLGITEVIMPEFDDIMNVEQNIKHHCYDVGRHTLKALTYVPADKILRLTMLFHDMGKAHTKTTDEKGVDHFHGHSVVSEKIASKIMRRLKYDKHTITNVIKLVKYHDERVKPIEAEVRKAVSVMGREIIELLFIVQYADCMAQSEYNRNEKLARIEGVKQIYNMITVRGDCVDLSTLALKGKDLISLGINQGESIGKVLGYLLQKVIENPENNNREYLANLVRELIALNAQE